MYQKSKLQGAKLSQFLSYRAPPPSSSAFQMLSSSSKNAFLIRESDLLDTSISFEEFVDSFDSNESEKMEIGVLTAPPSLESLLNNLNLDKPVVSQQRGESISTSRINYDAEIRRKNSITWLSTVFKWEPTNENNLIIDAGSTDSKPIILYATKMKLIEKLTTVLDYKFMDDFLLTIEMIMHPMDFASCLLSRLAQAFNAVPGWNSNEEIDPEVVKMRGLIVLQHWAGIHVQNDESIQNTLDLSIRKTVIEALDLIWQQSRTLSQSDQRFLIKIRRLFDPQGEISVTTQVPEMEEDTANNFSNSSSLFDSEGFREPPVEETQMRWREKLKLRLKSIFINTNSFSKQNSFRNNSTSSPQSSSSFLMNSFTSEGECSENISTVLMTQRSKNLAMILSILEWDLFNGIQRSEIVSFPSVRESPQRLGEECSNLQRAIEHFNSMCQWFVHIISHQEDDDASLLAKIIRLAVKCILIHNYNSALQIILALQSPAVSVRKDLWLSLPSWERRLAKDLAVFGSPMKNFKNVRKALEEVQKEDLPVIPFNGLFLSDLVFNWERPQKEYSTSFGHLIPFYKNNLAAKIVRQFVSFKNPRHRFEKELSGKERQLYSYFADIGRLGGEFSM